MRDGRAVLHCLPTGYSIDAAAGIREPRGMLGRRFGVDMHVVTADVAAVRNLMLAVERCHLAVETMVAAPYVAGLAVLADDEADLGAASSTWAPAPRRWRCFPAADSSMPTVSPSAATTSPWTSPAA